MRHIAMVLLVLSVCLLGAALADAQPCRRSCQDGESRDARGCCVPTKAPKGAEKEAGDTARTKHRRDRPKDTGTGAAEDGNPGQTVDDAAGSRRVKREKSSAPAGETDAATLTETVEPEEAESTPSQPPTATLKVVTEPADALVELGVGTTPVRPGTYVVSSGVVTIRVTRVGYRPETRDIILDADEIRTVAIRLAKLPAPKPGPTSRPPRDGSFLQAHGPKLLTGLGTAALAYGVVLIAIDEDNGVRDGVRHATYVDSAPMGYGAAAVGVVVGFVGLYMWLSRGDRSNGTVTITPIRRGTALSWRTSF